MYGRRPFAFLIAVAVSTVVVACGGEGADAPTLVTVDGSSTVFPISMAMAEEYQLSTGGSVRVTVGVSGTGGGFKKFCAGETDVSDASREIKESEIQACREARIEPIEIPVAWDGLTVVVHPENDWADCMTVDELKRLWQPGSTIERWKQIRPEWPDEEIKLYGPDTDSGTFDYFTEAVVGEEDASRSDYTASADDNVLVIGVEGDPGALGYFGFAYYEENRDRLRAVAVDDGDGCVAPTRETIENGRYQPLSRPMFIYVRRDALERPEVAGFVEFYLNNAPELVPEVGYVPLEAERYGESLRSIGAHPGS